MKKSKLLALVLLGGLAFAPFWIALNPFAADISQSNWSQSDASNSSASPDGAPEGMAPSGVNNTMRAMMGALKRFYDHVNSTVTASGSAGTYALSYSVAPATYANGETYSFRANHTNAGAATVNINSLGNRAIVKPSTNGLIPLAASDISSGNHVVVQYDSTEDKFAVVSLLGTAAGGSASGDVTGPSVAVSGNIVLFSGSSGKIVQESAIAATSIIRAGKNTAWIPAGAMIARATTGAAVGQIETTTNKVNVRVLDYDQTTVEYAAFNAGMPKSWDESTLTATFMWTAASGTGDVVWAIQCLAVSNDDALDQAYGTAQSVTDTLITANDNHVSPETAAITCAGTPAEGDLLLFQVYRDASVGGDTLSADARLIGVRLIYTTNAANDN